MDTSTELHALLESWKKEQSESIEKQLHELMSTPEYAALPYHVRNKGFITSSKLKDYADVPLFAMWRHLEGRETAFDDKDCFTMGSAIDDRLTRGDEFYAEKYAVVSRRNTKEAIALEEAGKVLLTESQGSKINDMHVKARKHPLFPKEPKKHHLLWLAFGKIPCKAELDHFDPHAVMFGDFKTTSSLLTFDKYINEGFLDIQLGFYWGGLLEKYNIKAEGELYVMDKHDWCRAHVWHFRSATLEALQGRVNTLIQDWALAEESEVWPAPDTSTLDGLKRLWNSPFYDQWEDSLNVPPSIV